MSTLNIEGIEGMKYTYIYNNRYMNIGICNEEARGGNKKRMGGGEGKNWVIIILGYIFGIFSLLAQLFLIYMLIFLFASLENGHASPALMLTMQIIILLLLFLDVFGVILDYMMGCVNYSLFLDIRKLAFGGLVVLGVLILLLILMAAFLGKGSIGIFSLVGLYIAITQVPLFLFAAYAFHYLPNTPFFYISTY